MMNRSVKRRWSLAVAVLATVAWCFVSLPQRTHDTVVKWTLKSGESIELAVAYIEVEDLLARWIFEPMGTSDISIDQLAPPTEVRHRKRIIYSGTWADGMDDGFVLASYQEVSSIIQKKRLRRRILQISLIATLSASLIYFIYGFKRDA